MFDNLRNRLNFDDLLFEKRNREYGAYQLRKRYNAVVTGSIIIAVLMFSLAVILPYVIRPNEEKVLIAGAGYMVPVQMENLDIPEEIIVPPAAAPPPKALPEIIKYIPPEVVDTVDSEQNLLPTSDEMALNPVNDEIEVIGSGSGEDLVEGTGLGSNDDAFFMVEVMPAFKGGGIEKFREWVVLRTNYPQEAIDRKLKGQVFLTFIVGTDGLVSDVTIVKGVDPIIDNEALKTIQSSPKWTPGLQRGKPVRVRYSISINFQP